uniref:Uncharacterized protein n=1 Tax=Candidatus Methanophagaceae archaeon ANME-1 ERB6 TaxID=2759912 RepID=A0A7G9YYQ4_9EURY|nr:hypothetical protein GJIJNDME_00024 [Methanosarcinales archaeon ANME-1 ERB6]
MELWQILLGIAFLFAVLAFAYLLIGRLRRREKMRGKAIIGIALAAIVVAAVMAMVPAASAGVGGNEGMFMGLKGISYVLMGLSFLSAILALGYFIIKMIRKAARRRKFKSKEEEIIETIKEVKELRKSLEEKGVNLTSLSDVFSVQVSILSEIRGLNRGIDDIKSWILLELGLLTALSLAIISMAAFFHRRMSLILTNSITLILSQVGAHSGI